MRSALGSMDARLQARAVGLVKPFIKTAALFLILVGCAKLLTVPTARTAGATEALTQMPWAVVLALTGTWEVWLGFAAWRSLAWRRSLLLLGFTSFVFLLYRVALWLMSVDQPCGGLGGLAAWMHLPPRSVDLFLIALLLFWLTGSLVFLILGSAREAQDRRANREVR